MKTPLIFTDLDGSLLDHHNYTLTAAEPLLEVLSEQSITVIPNTSKTFAEVTHFRQQYNFDGPFVCENGAAVFIPLNLFPQKPKGAIVYNGYWMKSFTHPRQYWLNLLAQQAGAFAACYESFNSMSLQRLIELTDLSPSDALRAQRRDFGEPLFWLASDSEKQSFSELFQGKGARVVAGGRFLHVGGQSCKGEAMAWLVDEYRRQYPGKTFASVSLGDGHNDKSMLEASDYAVRIKSPVNAFPKLARKDHIYDSTLTGPAGWAECMEIILQRHFGEFCYG